MATDTPRARDPLVKREAARFQAWLAERRISTAPVTTWPPDELDFFGGTAPKTKQGRAKRKKGTR